MKKLYISVLLLSIFMGGCSQQNTSQNEKPKIFSMNQKVNVGDLEIKVTKRTVAKTLYDYSGYLTYTADGVFLNVSLTAKNISNSSANIDEGSFRLKCGDKYYNVTSSLGMNQEKGFFYESMNPGITLKGTLHFDVPKKIANSKNLILEYNNTQIKLSK